MKQSIAILALLGYISKADAISVSYDKDDVGKDIKEINSDLNEIKTKLGNIDTYYKNQTDDEEDEEEDDNNDDEEDEDDGKEDENDEEEDDSGLPWITQKKLEQPITCDAGYKRFIAEGNGRIKVKGKLFEDISFPADNTSISWTSSSKKREW